MATKYLFLIFLLVGCVEEREPTFAPNGPHAGECHQMVSLHWIKDQASYDRCVAHMKNPKFKKGQLLKMNNSEYAANCKFQVGFTDWSGVRNAPMYGGSVSCKNIDNKYETVDSLAFMLESKLK